MIPREDRLPSPGRVKEVEQYAIAYPRLDKNIINMVLDFDKANADKWGEDYDIEEHLDELLSGDNSERDSESTVATSGSEQDVTEGGQSSSDSNSATK